MAETTGKAGEFVGTDQIRGVEVEIRAVKSGSWIIYLGEQRLAQGADLQKVKTTAGASLAKSRVKVSVPFFTLGGEGGEATGVHVSNRSILAKVDGVAVQLTGRERELSGNTPPAVIAELQRLVEVERDAARKIQGIRDAHRIDLRAAVHAAIDAQGEGEG